MHILRRADISLELAEATIAAAQAKASELGLHMAIAVVDAGGNLVAARRMDGAQLCGLPLAIDKAWTAVATEAATGDWQASSQPGGEDFGFNTTLGGRVVVLAGGLPLRHDGEAIGGIGVSGGYAADDRACAEAGAAALATA
jgi:uncharacterized protein GlcG (DUF336 family)